MSSEMLAYLWHSKLLGSIHDYTPCVLTHMFGSLDHRTHRQYLMSRYSTGSTSCKLVQSRESTGPRHLHYIQISCLVCGKQGMTSFLSRRILVWPQHNKPISLSSVSQLSLVIVQDTDPSMPSSHSRHSSGSTTFILPQANPSLWAYQSQSYKNNSKNGDSSHDSNLNLVI